VRWQLSITGQALNQGYYALSFNRNVPLTQLESLSALVSEAIVDGSYNTATARTHTHAHTHARMHACMRTRHARRTAAHALLLPFVRAVQKDLHHFPRGRPNCAAFAAAAAADDYGDGGIDDGSLTLTSFSGIFVLLAVGTSASVLCKLAVVHWRRLFGCKNARPSAADEHASKSGGGNGDVAAALAEHRAVMAAALEAANAALDARIGASLHTVAVARGSGSGSGRGAAGAGGAGEENGGGAALGVAASPARVEALLHQDT
jgi:hypothetical protein